MKYFIHYFEGKAMTTRKTKIICTIGPAVAELDNLVKLINGGMDAARLNFSHGSHDLHAQPVKDIREAAQMCGKHITILQDLQGPKIRTAIVENGAVQLSDGENFTITMDDMPFGNAERVSTNYKNLINEVKIGNTILLDDGYLILNVTAIKGNDIITKIIKGGVLKNNKGIIVPGAKSLAPSLSEKDLDDLRFGLSIGVDAVALSFIRSARDVVELKTTMKLFGRAVPIISKIERLEGYEDIDNIIEESDGIMVARGDLGLEMPPEMVPILQKEIISKCITHAKPVIIATQMLESMIENPRPTRAEASDVANAVIDQADCVMLSAETSVGKYPFDAVDYMHRIVHTIEQKFNRKDLHIEYRDDSGDNDVCDALGKASFVIAGQINAKAVICLTSTGSTARNVAKYRPNMPIIVFTDNENTVAKLSFLKGVRPHLVKDYYASVQLSDEIKQMLINMPNLQVGDKVVIVAGISAKGISKKNFISVAEIGSDM